MPMRAPPGWKTWETYAHWRIDGLLQAVNRWRDMALGYRQTFMLQRKAQMRAIERWQQQMPGRELSWPDHADLVVWLMERLDERGGIPDPRDPGGGQDGLTLEQLGWRAEVMKEAQRRPTTASELHALADAFGRSADHLCTVGPPSNGAYSDRRTEMALRRAARLLEER